MAQVIIPAHDEAAVIARCLRSVLRPPFDPATDVLVVCNGCTDGTADVARAVDDRVRVVETDRASKSAALDLGDELAVGFPRLYLDADVELGPGALRALCAALDSPGIEVAAPRRVLDLAGASLPARSYFALWSALPSVRLGVSGRGAFALNAAGRGRFARFAGVLADDLYMHTVFPDHAIRVVDGAEVVVRAPRTLRAVVDRRARTYNLRVQLAESRPELRDAIPGSSRSWMDAVRDRPRLAVHVPVFVAASVAARALAHHRRRTGRRDVWVRDDTSRGETVTDAP
jgi:glycosyltransferase involved in cell wall biosynthesis